MYGSQLIIQTLRRRGVTTIFSLSGNQIMPLYDACIDEGIRIVHVRHEAAAVFMADAWSQVTGELGVAMLTAAPGLTNGLAPLYSASLAESPVLLLSGDSPVGEDGMGAFQELDQIAITRPLTKLSCRPLTTRDLYPSLNDAIDTALAPRRGPVHLALPFDLLCAETELVRVPETAPQWAVPAADMSSLQKLSDLLSQARRPLVLAGPSAARAAERAGYKDLERSLGLRVVAMESPRGLKDPSLGSLASVLSQVDLLVLAGKSLDFTLGFGREDALGKGARVVVIDPDPNMLGRARKLLGERMVLAIQSEPRAALSVLPSFRAADSWEGWLAQVDQAVRNRETTPTLSDGLGPRALCETVQAFLSGLDDPILVCDGGEFGQWSQAFCEAPTRIINGMSGAIGAGVCYAIAAKIARPEATVVALMGDGTAGFHWMEFDTAVRERAPFIAVVGNDLRWNAEHLIQMRTYGRDRLIGCQLSETARYHDAVAALGGFGAAADDASGLAAALKLAQASGLPACVNVAMAGEAAPVFNAAVPVSSGH